jgi:L-fucose mutarotase/ribose pyranase (RbsD/FucU family)
MDRAYMQGILSIYQTDSMVDASTAAARAVEGDIIDVIEVDVGF